MKEISELYRYNSIVRKKYLDAIEKLPWEEVVRDRGASFPSIRDVFLHVLDAYRFWFRTIIKGEPYDRDYYLKQAASVKGVDEMRKFESELDSLVTEIIQNLREEDLSRVFVVQRSDGTKRDAPMEAILLHMIEEELQHRGEINCMFWQQNVDPPITGYGLHLASRK